MRSLRVPLLVTVVSLAALWAPSAQAAEFTPDTLADTHDAVPGDTNCADTEGQCSLRAAVEESNALQGSDAIFLNGGTYTLTLAQGGAVEITGDLTILGAGARSTIVEQETAAAGQGDRVFDIPAPRDGAPPSVELDDMTIRGGQGHAQNGFFGGDIRSAGKLVLQRSTVTGGTGDSAGGIANTGGTLVIDHTTVSGNVAPTSAGQGGDAGAILNFGTATQAAHLEITNSTISGNNARLAGGISSYNSDGNTVTIESSTITNNHSGDRGGAGGIAIGSGSATVHNSIVAVNTGGVGPNPDCEAASGTSLKSGGHNLESATECGFDAAGDIQNNNPGLAPLTNNGGQTDTHAPREGSPVIDRGDTASCPFDDQRGEPRPGGPACDIGAYEVPGPEVPTMRDIASGGPLSHIYVGNALNCQVQYVGDARYSFYGSTPGSCHTGLFIGGAPIGLSPLDLSPVTGSGTRGDPFKVTTKVAGAGGWTVTQTDSYVVGDDYYRTDITVTNGSDADQAGAVWHGADCYLQDSDTGYGFHDAQTNAVYCTANANNSPPARLEGFVPQSPGASWFEGDYGDAISPPFGGYPNTCLCDRPLDNGMGLSWAVSIPRGQSVTRSLLTTFSPRGLIFDETPPDTVAGSGPSGMIDSKSPTFTFSATEPGTSFQCSLDGGPFTACASPYSLSGLAPGRHTLRVRAVDANGNVDPTPAEFSFTVARQIEDLPVPQLGKQVNVDVVKGTVLVAVPAGAGAAGRGAHASQKGLKFVPLQEARQIPTGSYLDTKRGTVELVSATGAGTKTQSGRFTAGLFQVLQSRKKRDKGLTDLRLKGGSFNNCRVKRGKRGKRASAARLKKRTIRQVRSNAHGRFRTTGRHSDATVRGTAWITADRCDGTLTKVTRGTVAVRDFRRKKTILVKAGKSYLAKAPGA